MRPVDGDARRAGSRMHSGFLEVFFLGLLALAGRDRGHLLAVRDRPAVPEPRPAVAAPDAQSGTISVPRLAASAAERLLQLGDHRPRPARLDEPRSRPRTFGPIDPAPNSPRVSSASASSTVIRSMSSGINVPNPRWTFFTSVRISSSRRPRPRARGSPPRGPCRRRPPCRSAAAPSRSRARRRRRWRSRSRRRRPASRITGVSTIEYGFGLGTTRRHPPCGSAFITQPRCSSSCFACASVKNGPTNFVGLRNAGSFGRTRVSVRTSRPAVPSRARRRRRRS